MILNEHKNLLLKKIQDYGLDPALFLSENTTIDDTECFCISIRNSKILFAVAPDTTSFNEFLVRHARFQPDFPLTGLFYVANENDLYEEFGVWLQGVAMPYLDNIHTPNLWQILEDNSSRVKNGLDTSEEFEPFSEDQKIQIKLSLNEFRILIVNEYKPNKEVLESIDARLKYLSVATDKHNKFDWRGTAINTVISIGLILTLNPQQTNDLFQLFRQVFSNIIYLIQ